MDQLLEQHPDGALGNGLANPLGSRITGPGLGGKLPPSPLTNDYGLSVFSKCCGLHMRQPEQLQGVELAAAAINSTDGVAFLQTCTTQYFCLMFRMRRLPQVCITQLLSWSQSLLCSKSSVFCSSSVPASFRCCTRDSMHICMPNHWWVTAG